MKVDVKCFASLRDAETCDYKDSTSYEIASGETVGAFVDRLEVAKDDIRIVFLNNKVVDFDAELKDGDQLGLAPAVGGM